MMKKSLVSIERVYNDDNAIFTTLCIEELKPKFWI